MLGTSEGLGYKSIPVQVHESIKTRVYLFLRKVISGRVFFFFLLFSLRRKSLSKYKKEKGKDECEGAFFFFSFDLFW